MPGSTSKLLGERMPARESSVGVVLVTRRIDLAAVGVGRELERRIDAACTIRRGSDFW